MIAALAELDDDEIEALSHCNKEQAGALMNVVCNSDGEGAQVGVLTAII